MLSNIKSIHIRCLMLIMNIVAILFVTLLIYFTNKNICTYYIAREFLETVEAIPFYPSTLVWMSAVLLGLLVMTFIIRDIIYPNNNTVIFSTIIMDFVMSLLTVYVLNFNYNGILFWVFASCVSYTKGIRGRFVLMFLAIATFLIADYELLAINYQLFSIKDYIGYYDSNIQQSLMGLYNVLVSINIILFIVYCIYVIQEQRGTINEVKTLYKKLSLVNDELQNANIELQNYAIMKEKMGETKERNRLAREIHDTLGHTLTGISAGIDACMTTLVKSPETTKKQLEVISQVTRQGILDIRRSVNELRPDALSRLSLEYAVSKMIADMNAVTNTKVYFECHVSKLKFDEDEENAIYRVIQESLTNAIRHGKASEIEIEMKKEYNEILLTIKDNGVGCKNIVHGFGTKHILERIHRLNGTVTFEGSNGFMVNARIPIRWGEEYD